jgi:hypothetical protein
VTAHKYLLTISPEMRSSTFLDESGKPSFNALQKHSLTPVMTMTPKEKRTVLPVRFSIGIGMLVEAYEKYQADKYGQGDAKDAYGFLSEHSHPNSIATYQAARGAIHRATSVRPSQR